MRETDKNIVLAMNHWAEEMADFSLPAWESIPQLALYMDQVIILLTQYLGPLARTQGEKGITASIINNYVRLKIMPPPVKKKYGRVHLAYLIILCMLKQSLSISAIRRMLPDDHSEEATKMLYEAFRKQFKQITDTFVRDLQCREPLLLPHLGDSPVTAAAIISNLSKDLTEVMLQAGPKETVMTE